VTLSSTESLEPSVGEGGFKPSELDDCNAEIALDRNPQIIRYTEFTLFAERDRPPYREPAYLIVQPQVLAQLSKDEQQTILNHDVRPVVRRALERLPTAGLPPRDAKADEIRDALRDLAAEATRSGGRVARSRAPGVDELNTRELPAIDLPDRELQTAYRAWRRREEGRLIRTRFESLAAYRLRPRLVDADVGIDAEAVVDYLDDVYFPNAFQPIYSPYGHLALCATFAQEWRLLGYTRGELISNLSLAPGEELTLEVHTWDKSSRKSEDELATESEVRTSEKLTQRDALTVVQESAKQMNTNVTVNGEVPIPKMPLQVSATVTTETRDSINRTQENVSERTFEAANSLRVNRKTKIEIARETGREERQTRTLKNSNRCHSLNCFHFEMIANYCVRTRLVSVQPCLLLSNPKPEFTADWVLCHEDVLIASLLDRIFLPGFDAARLLRTSEELRRIAEERAAAALEQAGQDVAPQVAELAAAYERADEAREVVAAAIADCTGIGLIDIICLHEEATTTDLDRTITWFALPSRTQTALAALKADFDGNENPATALRRYLAATAASDFAYDLPEDQLQLRLVDFGLGAPFQVKQLLDGRGPDERDDGGLRAADEAARALVSSLPEVDQGLEDDVAPRDLAEAKVAFDQLVCHLEDNWLHYMHMIWLRENHDQRFLRLQSLGPIATIIENELLGFYADRAAYPLRQTDNLQDSLDLDEIIDEARKLIDAEPSPPVLLAMPTPGILLEAVTGQCDACEDFIHKSRLIDLRAQNARAKQEEAEADRRRARVDQNDLSNPEPDTARVVVEVRGVQGAGSASGETSAP
jgi:hypothetical protein